MNGMTKDNFKTLNADQKLDYIYEILGIVCTRMEKLEKYKWWNRALVLAGSAVGGGVMVYLKGVL